MPLPHEENRKHTFIRQCWDPGWGRAKVTCAERGWLSVTQSTKELKGRDAAESILAARPPKGRAATKSHSSGCRPQTPPHRQAIAVSYQGARGAPALAEGGPGGVGSAESPGSRDEPTCNTPFHPMRQEGSPVGLIDRGAGYRGTRWQSAGSRRKDAAGKGSQDERAAGTGSNVPPGPACKEP